MSGACANDAEEVVPLAFLDGDRFGEGREVGISGADWVPAGVTLELDNVIVCQREEDLASVKNWYICSHSGCVVYIYCTMPCYNVNIHIL